MAKKNLKGSKDRYPKGKNKTKAYPSVKSKDFAGKGRKYPISTKADAVDALRLAGLHGRSDVKSKVYKKYPSLKNNKKYAYGGTIPKYTYGTNNTVPLSALQAETPSIDTYDILTDRYNTIAPNYRWNDVPGTVTKIYNSNYAYDGNIPELNSKYSKTGISNPSNSKNSNFLDFGEQGNFGNTQYGDFNASGAMSAAGAIGSVGSSLIDQYGKTDEQQMYTDSGSSWSQDLVGSAGPWGAAISGVSQLGGSALETGIDYDEYGIAENQDYNKFASSLETGLLDPAQNLNVALSDEYSTEERIGAALLPGLAGIFEADKEQEEAEKRRDEAEKLKREAMRANTPEPSYRPTITYPNGGTVEYDPKKIIDLYGALGITLSKDTNLIPSDVQKYDSTRYLGPADMATHGYTGATFVQDSTKGVPVNYYRTFKNKSDTTKTIESPLIDSDVWDKYMEYPNGGISSYTNYNPAMNRPNAELETDEVYRKPNGDIDEVPENTPGHKDGGIKLSLPEGTEILGKMKGKYNGKSYKELGQTLQEKYEKYNSIVESSDKTRIAKATAKKMLDKVQAQFDELLQQQEVQKMINGSQSTNTYAKGGTVPKYPDGGEVLKWMRSTKPDPTLAEDFVKFAAKEPGYFGQNTISTDLDSVMSYWNQVYSGKNNWVGDTSKPEQWATGPALYKYATDPDAAKSISGYQGPSYEDDINYDDLYRSEVANMNDYMSGTEVPQNGDINIVDEDTGGRGLNLDWGRTGDYLGTAAQLAPAAYNMYQGIFGETDELDYSDYRNPYTGRIMRDLEDRRYNIRPELEANELAYQTAKRNVRQVAPGVGNLLSNYGALSGGRMRADAQAYAKKQNMENQWRGQDAQILANMGAQEAATKLNVDDYNAQARAAKQQALSTGLDQLAGSAANMLSERNLKSNDAGLYSVLDSYASAFDLGDLTNNQYQDIIRILQRDKKTKQGE